MPPDLSVIIPVFNRGDLIRYTLESVRRASIGLDVEVIVVDDGSAEPIAESITRLGYQPAHLFRQHNQGLLFARLAGWKLATGAHVLFLDSDDIVSTEKFRIQLAAMDATDAVVSYTDDANVTLEGDYDKLVVKPNGPLRQTNDTAEFFIEVQPPPHSPIFRADYLRRLIECACFPPSPLYNPAAEIWFYQNGAPQPGRVVHVPGPHTIVGTHSGTRLTNHWERLAVASLAVMEAFARSCPTDTAPARRARQLLGQVAFQSWRKLPRGFSPEFKRRELALSRRLMTSADIGGLGGRWFRALARIIGPVGAARIFQLYQSDNYEKVRTMDDASFGRLLAALPSP